ncbi:MAG: response regulator, partial [Wujia sp.]
QILFSLVTDLIGNDIEKLNFKADWTYIDLISGNLYINIVACAANIYNNIKADVNFPTELYKCIVNLLGGEGTMTDNGNQVTFLITLPLHIAKCDKAKKSTDDLDYIAPSARILIVDDYDVNITVLTMLLKRTQIQIDSATSGNEALEKLESNSYDIIFIDYLMPEMDGIALMGQIRERFPDVPDNTAIYVLSANSFANDKQLLKTYGFKGFIPKPIDSSTLDFIVRNNIPENKLMYLENVDKESISDEKLEEYRSLLKKYDISLDDGLHYMSNDFQEYINISEVTSKHIPKNTERLNKFLSEEDIESIQILVHSIKSNSKLLGFNSLSLLATQLEARASQGDIEYVYNAFPFFMYLRKQFYQGIVKFLEQAEIDGLIEGDSVIADKINRENFLQLLDDYIDNLEPEPAIRVINSAIQQGYAPEINEALRKIADYIEELEYESAAKLLKEITQ